MSEPTPEHVDAVAHRLAMMPGPTRGDRYARWLLTDPPEAVLDAMQDALVRAGRLTETRHEWGVLRPEPFDGVVSDELMQRHDAEEASKVLGEPYGREWQIVTRRRYVTDWREVTDA